MRKETLRPGYGAKCSCRCLGKGSRVPLECEQQGAGHSAQPQHPNLACVPSSTELTGLPLAGTHHHPSPSHPRQCTVGTQQRATSVGV